jgi:hypothetical protein
MAVEDLFEGGGGWGVGTVALLAGAAVLLSTRGRPLLKGAIVGYFAATERVRELAAEAGEQLQDLYEEARAEFESAREGTQDLVESGEPPPPARPPRPRAGRGRRPARG